MFICSWLRSEPYKSLGLYSACSLAPILKQRRHDFYQRTVDDKQVPAPEPVLTNITCCRIINFIKFRPLNIEVDYHKSFHPFEIFSILSTIL